MTTLLAATTMGHALAQGVTTHVLVSAACFELNQTVMTQMAMGQVKEAELAVSAVLASGNDHTQGSCAGLVLSNMATFMAVAGRIADAERFAERSVGILEKAYSPSDTLLLNPLKILATARFEQGSKARAREAFKRMQSIRIERPEKSALFHGTAAVLLQGEGRRSEAEKEYLGAFRAWEEAGRDETADAGVILIALGSLYIEEQRLAEARRTLDRALTIFSRAKDTVPMDHIKLLNARGALHAWQGDWREAEQEFHDALSIADRQPSVNPVPLRSLLSNYAHVLRRNHHRREARSIEARAAALQPDRTAAAIVDITDLLPKAKRAKK
jgi:tetratricopeptide (TPR) repeat protein